jgi:hypothetical protein
MEVLANIKSQHGAKNGPTRLFSNIDIASG